VAQGFLVGDVDFGIDAALADARDHVFHRVLGRDDAGVDVVQVVDGSVERGCLARAGGTGHQDHATGHVQHVVAETLDHAWCHADVVDVQQIAPVVQKPQYDLLTVDGGVERDAHVNFHALVLEVHAAVLVTPPFGDVGPGHDFDAAGQGGSHFLGQVQVLDEDAVFPETNPHLVLHGFDVDVAGVALHTVLQEFVDGANHFAFGVAVVGLGAPHLLKGLDGGLDHIFLSQTGFDRLTEEVFGFSQSLLVVWVIQGQ